MNRAMSLPAGDRDGMWADHRTRTRRAILDSFLTMLGEENPSTISMPAVARRAGVSVRTLYRYFNDKDALMAAASHSYDDDARVTVAAANIDTEILPFYLDTLWRTFAENLPAVRAQHTGPVGRELRQRRLERSRAEMAERMPTEVPADRHAEVIDLIIAVSSSSMFLELVDRMGHPPERAAGMVVRLVDLVVADAMATDAPATPRRGTTDHGRTTRRTESPEGDTP